MRALLHATRTRRALAASACAAALGVTPVTGHAGPVLDRVRASGAVHCGAVARPGLAARDADGTWRGLLPDLCRAIAVAALGPAGQVQFHAIPIYAPGNAPAVPPGDDVAFLTASDLLAAHALAVVSPGQTVFFQSTSILVLTSDPARTLAGLQDHTICAEPGTGAERNLGAWAAASGITVRFFPFQEAEEMQDAFYARRCAAIAADSVDAASLRLQAGADGHPARLLQPALALNPLQADTPRGDADWASVVAWTIGTLLQADLAAGPGAGAPSLALDGAALGLAPDWQARVRRVSGSYARLYDANIGSDTALSLPPGPNAVWTAGGLLCPPYSE